MSEQDTGGGGDLPDLVPFTSDDFDVETQISDATEVAAEIDLIARTAAAEREIQRLLAERDPSHEPRLSATGTPPRGASPAAPSDRSVPGARPPEFVAPRANPIELPSRSQSRNPVDATGPQRMDTPRPPPIPPIPPVIPPGPAMGPMPEPPGPARGMQPAIGPTPPAIPPPRAPGPPGSPQSTAPGFGPPSPPHPPSAHGSVQSTAPGFGPLAPPGQRFLPPSPQMQTPPPSMGPVAAPGDPAAAPNRVTASPLDPEESPTVQNVPPVRAETPRPAQLAAIAASNPAGFEDELFNTEINQLIGGVHDLGQAPVEANLSFTPVPTRARRPTGPGGSFLPPAPPAPVIAGATTASRSGTGPLIALIIILVLCGGLAVAFYLGLLDGLLGL